MGDGGGTKRKIKITYTVHTNISMMMTGGRLTKPDVAGIPTLFSFYRLPELGATGS